MDKILFSGQSSQFCAHCAHNTSLKSSKNSLPSCLSLQVKCRKSHNKDRISLPLFSLFHSSIHSFSSFKFVSTDVIERWIDFYSYSVPTHSSLVAVAHNTMPRPLLGSNKQCNNARDALLRLPEGGEEKVGEQIGRQHICRINDTQQNCGEIWWEGRLKLKSGK